MDTLKDMNTEDVMDPENNVDPENNLDKEKEERAREGNLDTEEDMGAEEEVDTKSMSMEKGVDVESDSDIENIKNTKEEDTEKKATDTGKIKVRKLKLLKNRVTLLHISRKIVEQETLEKMKNCVLEKNNSLKVEDLSELTSLKLISLMEDEGMISMTDCTCLKSIFEKMELNELEKELSEKCKYSRSCYSRVCAFFFLTRMVVFIFKFLQAGSGYNVSSLLLLRVVIMTLQ